VPSRYGWSHSLAMDGAPAVQQAQRHTPANWPWIIHAAEGTDAAAAAECGQLDALGCLTRRSVLVHGVALTTAQQQRLVEAGAGLVWCPGSNLHLFGQTPDIRWLHARRRVALGSDSRISGESDLLAELRLARAQSGLDDAGLESLVTDRAADLLGLSDRGSLQPGALGDLLVLPADLPLWRARRSDIRLLLIGGVPRYADPDLAAAFGPGADLLPVSVDGQPKFLAREIVEALGAAQVAEPGLCLHTSLSVRTA